MSKRIAVIVEGGKRERGYWKSIENTFFPNTAFSIVPLSAEENIYMIWKQLRADEFNTDIIELVRECSPSARKALEGYERNDFQEIYLFFDYDPQQNNLGVGGEDPDSVLQEMMQTFNNETEFGRLYISYPMCEALRDIRNGSCVPLTMCLLSSEKIPQYKLLSGKNSRFSDYRKYTLQTWSMFITVFIKRVACLFGTPALYPDVFKWIKSSVTPSDIFGRVNSLYRKQKMIFILSAFPEFLIDYYTIDYLSQHIEVLPAITDSGCSQKELLSSE